MRAKSLQLCLTLCKAMDCSLLGSSALTLTSLATLALQMDSLPLSTQRSSGGASGKESAH